MKSKLKIITRYIEVLGVLTLTVSLTVSCANRGSKTAGANNPYSSNPYYSTPNDSSSSASSAGSSQYPSYDDAAANTPPVVPATQPETYPSYTGGGASNPYPGYSGAGTPTPAANPYPVDTGYSGGGYSSGGSTHTVAGGENLYRISLRYGTTVSALQSANGLNSTTIYPGQVLRIP